MSLSALDAHAPEQPPVYREDLILAIPADRSLDELRSWIQEHTAPHSLAGRRVRLDIGSRALDLFEIRRLVALLQDDFEAENSGLIADRHHIHRFAERQLKLDLYAHEDLDDVAPEHITSVDLDDTLKEPPPPAFFPVTEDSGGPDSDFLTRPSPPIAPARAEPSGRRTMSLHRTLRSGTVVRFDGDVVIFGDVNPGAQVIAAGNVTIMGALKGMAHAGATGADDCFIFAFELHPTQIRIGRKIAIPPDEGNRRDEPEFARLVDSQILIEPYRARSAR
ncbi:MAG: hypothetical protein JXX28_07275 [Deltaproteobacteria bacterium]|nr:hypothetical protein [Deltaproteobacteria bacterium]